MLSSRIYQIAVLASGLFVISLCGCRAGQANRPSLFPQPGVAANQQNLGQQLGQRVGNIAVSRLVNEGITRVIGGL